MAVVSTPEYQESSWGKGWPARKVDNLTAICEPIVSSTSHRSMGHHGLLQGKLYRFYLYQIITI
jgi:hypothetical protein